MRGEGYSVIKFTTPGSIPSSTRQRITITSFSPPKKNGSVANLTENTVPCIIHYNKVSKFSQYEQPMRRQNNENRRQDQRPRAFNPNNHLMKLNINDALKDHRPLHPHLL